MKQGRQIKDESKRGSWPGLKPIYDKKGKLIGWDYADVVHPRATLTRKVRKVTRKVRKARLSR